MNEIKPNTINLRDRIFLGEALFETLKVSDTEPLNAKLHWQRLKNSAASMHIPFNLSFEDWFFKLDKAIASSQIVNGGLKVILSAGITSRMLSEPSKDPWIEINCFDYVANHYPLKLLSSPWLRDAKNPIYQHKTVNYLESILASRYAKDKGADEALFFNMEGYCQETTIANIFMVKDNELYTPALKNGLVPGITRQLLIESCAKNQIVCNEANLKKDDLMQADVIFTTNSLQGLRAIYSWNDAFFSIEHPLLEQLKTLL